MIRRLTWHLPCLSRPPPPPLRTFLAANRPESLVSHNIWVRFFSRVALLAILSFNSPNVRLRWDLVRSYITGQNPSSFTTSESDSSLVQWLSFQKISRCLFYTFHETRELKKATNCLTLQQFPQCLTLCLVSGAASKKLSESHCGWRVYKWRCRPAGERAIVDSEFSSTSALYSAGANQSGQPVYKWPHKIRQMGGVVAPIRVAPLRWSPQQMTNWFDHSFYQNFPFPMTIRVESRY